MRKIYPVTLISSLFLFLFPAHGQGINQFQKDASAVENTIEAALGDTADASRFTDVVNNSAIAHQFATAEYDLMQVDGLIQRDRQADEGVNHSFDFVNDPDYEQAFYGANDKAVCGSNTYTIDSQPAEYIQCDLSNGLALITTAVTDVDALPTNTSDSAFNTWVSRAQTNVDLILGQWQTAQNDAASLTDSGIASGAPTHQYQEIYYKIYVGQFLQGTQGCTGVAPGPAGCGQEAAVFISKLLTDTCPTVAGHTYDKCFNIIQNAGQTGGFMTRIAMDDVMGVAKDASPLEHAIEELSEPQNFVPYRLGTDTAGVEMEQAAESSVDNALNNADLYNGATWNATDAAAFHIMVLLTGYSCSQYCP